MSSTLALVPLLIFAIGRLVKGKVWHCFVSHCRLKRVDRTSAVLCSKCHSKMTSGAKEQLHKARIR
jgi:hypothetical protein